jgi:signal transduction histidine kinase
MALFSMRFTQQNERAMAIRMFRKGRQIEAEAVVSEAVLRAVMAAFWFAGWFFIGPVGTDEWQRLVLWVLHITFGVLVLRAVRASAPIGRVQTTIRFLTLIIIVGFFLQPESFNTLSPIVAMLAAMRLSRFRWVVWALIVAALNVASETGQGGYPLGFYDGLVQGTIILAFATFAFSLNRAQAARLETQTVLADLREAHQRLQDYAEQVQDLAVAEERTRISRDLHDTLGHRLTASIVQLEGAGRLVPDQQERAIAMIDTVREQLQEGLQDVRRTVSRLRSPSDVEPSLSATLTGLVTNFERATHLAIKLSVPAELPPIVENRRLALYLATQEALTNIQRHANAGAASVQVAIDPAHTVIVVRVQDDGDGMTAEAIGSGYGLRGMRERITHLGGTVDIDSALNEGTVVFVSMPVGEDIDPV